VTANASLYVSIGIDVSTAGSKNASPSECPGTVSIMERIYLRCADSRCSLWQHATDIMEASAKFQLLEIYMIDSAETVKIGFFECKTCRKHLLCSRSHFETFEIRYCPPNLPKSCVRRTQPLQCHCSGENFVPHTVNFKIIEYTSNIKKSIYYSFFRM
jgi:hypothetical protein